MHKIEIPHKRLVREFPSEIKEMNQDQFIYFIELVLLEERDQLDLLG